jgi:3'-phosphoadenosine 5'-phosphosulfate sulfotransferase (PAPS reductase)/FAD synthetase
MRATANVRKHNLNADLLNRKVEEAVDLIRRVSCDSHSVVFSSFGKDSLALLSLVSEAKADLDVATFELGIVPEKHIFSRAYARQLAKTVHALHPHRTTLVRGKNDDSLAYHFELAGGGSIRILGATFDDAMRPGMLCGLRHDLVRSGDHEPYPWQVVLCGRRACDQDTTVGSLSWDAPVEPIGGSSSVVMPLLDWSDEDLLSYLDLRNITPDPLRYERIENVLREQPGKIANPDHLSCCIRCLSARRGERLYCPLSNSEVTSFNPLCGGESFIPGNVSPAVMC